MKRFIEKILYLFQVSAGCRRCYWRARTLLKEVKPHDRLMQKTLNKALLYCLFIPPLAFEYATLVKHKPTKDEIDLLLLLSIFSILHDTLLDETKNGKEWLSALLYNENYSSDDSTELQTLTRNVYEKIKATKKLFLIEYLYRVHEAQLFSADLQNRTAITVDDIRQSLFYKGIVYPIYISAFANELTAQEFQSFCNLGGWLQSTDDLSDRKQDQHEGIVTLATFSHGNYANEIEHSLWNSFYNSFQQLAYDEDRKVEFISNMKLMGRIYQRYTYFENTVPFLKTLTLKCPLVFTRVPIWIASLMEIAKVV